LGRKYNMDEKEGEGLKHRPNVKWKRETHSTQSVDRRIETGQSGSCQPKYVEDHPVEH
jgi:hypothetical protein